MDRLKKRFQVLLIKEEVTEGVFLAPDPATDSVPIEDMTFDPGAQTDESTENTGTLDKGTTTVTHLQPSISGTMKARGAASASVEPRYGAILRSGSMGLIQGTVLPSSGKTTAASGTTSSFVVDRTAGNGTQWPSTPEGCAALIGRFIEIDTNPATLRRAQIADCTITGTNVTVVLGEDLAGALDATSTVKVLPGPRYAPVDTSIVSLSVEFYRDGKRIRMAGVRATQLDLNIPGAKRGTWTIKLEGKFVSETDTANPTVNHTGIPEALIWRKGRSRLDRKVVMATSLAVRLGITSERHPAPEEDFGVDTAQITGRDVSVELVANSVYIVTQDRLAQLVANQEMSLCAACDIDNAAAGARMGVVAPRFKYLGRTDAGQGIADDTLPGQAVTASPKPSVVVAFA